MFRSCSCIQWLLLHNKIRPTAHWNSLKGGFYILNSVSVMSPGPVFLPLTTRGHHLPSSWTHFPKLHTPVTHHTPSCSPSSWTIYTPHSGYSACWNCVCMCFVTVLSHAGDTWTVCCFLCPSRLPVLFLALLAFWFIIKAFFLHLDADPVLPRRILSPFRDS